ncbi:MAG: hypothetical protein QNJ45_03850 [Ardenticatenaceae bacterium]|nr:hypothetical protein [Ardenticatenaceae bacterium]
MSKNLFLLLISLLILGACSSVEVDNTLVSDVEVSEIENKLTLAIRPVKAKPPTKTRPIPSPVVPTKLPISTSEGKNISVSMGPPAGFIEYLNPAAKVSLFIPENWRVQTPDHGHFVHIYSYPAGKYVGGETFKPGDMKCDLFFTSLTMEEYLQKSEEDRDKEYSFEVISEQEVVLLTGQTGIKREEYSFGHSNSLVAEINEGVVIFRCYGDLSRFDEVADTLHESES